MTKKRTIAKPLRPEGVINPHFFYRRSHACEYFGLRPTQISERINSGDIPPPVKLTDSGNATGWFGRQIIEWQDQRIEASKIGESK